MQKLMSYSGWSLETKRNIRCGHPTQDVSERNRASIRKWARCHSSYKVTLVHERGRGGAISLHCDCGLRNLMRLNFKVMSTVCLVEKVAMQE